MNIQDKFKLASEVYRILRPGGRCIFFDQMASNGPFATSAGWLPCCGDRSSGLDVNKALCYPLPWATQEEESHCAPVEEYKAAFNAAGFKLVANLEEDRTSDMLSALSAAQKRMIMYFV